MKRFLALAVVVVAVASVPGADAQNRVYTWTDSRGKLHLSDEPPPSDATLKDVVDTPGPKPAEAAQQKQQSRMAPQDQQRRAQIEETERRARAAKEAAQAAVQNAQEQAQRAADIRKRFGNTPSRRQQFKYKIRDAENQAEAAQAEAQKAVDASNAAAEEAHAAADLQK